MTDFYRGMPIDDALDDYRAWRDEQRRKGQALTTAQRIADQRERASIWMAAYRRAYSEQAKRTALKQATRHLLRAVTLELKNEGEL